MYQVTYIFIIFWNIVLNGFHITDIASYGWSAMAVGSFLHFIDGCTSEDGNDKVQALMMDRRIMKFGLVLLIITGLFSILGKTEVEELSDILLMHDGAYIQDVEAIADTEDGIYIDGTIYRAYGEDVIPVRLTDCLLGTGDIPSIVMRIKTKRWLIFSDVSSEAIVYLPENGV